MSSLLGPPLPLLKTTVGTRDDETLRKRTSIRVPEARAVIAATVQRRKQIERETRFRFFRIFSANLDLGNAARLTIVTDRARASFSSCPQFCIANI